MDDSDSKQDNQPGAEEKEAAPESKVEDQKEQKEEVDISSISLDKILEREDVVEAIARKAQSAKDSELSKIQKELRADKQRADMERKQQVEQDELRKLLEDEDYEAIGKRSIKKQADETQYQEMANRLSTSLENQIKESPKYADMGDAVDRIFNKVKSEKGTVIDFVSELEEEKREKAVSTVTTQLQETFKGTINEEIDARLVELGLKKREEQAEAGQVPSGNVSKTSPGQQQREFTRVEIEDAYGKGTLPGGTVTYLREKAKWEEQDAELGI